MEEHNFVVGQEFTDVKAFRKAIKEAANAQHFGIPIIKSYLIRYFANCASEGCPWRIRAVKLSNAPTFTIRSLEGTHACGRNAHDGHHQASIDWIVSFIYERLRSDINYKPKDILHDIYKQYGIKISYKQAWRAKERGLAAIYGSSEEGYYLLPAYCEQIKSTNPGSVAEVFTTGIQLKGKYLGTLFSATTFDANGGSFPLAFGIVDAENDESWMWFLSEFGKIGKEFKNIRLVHLLWKAAYATTTIVFKEKMAAFEEISSDAANWWILEAQELRIIQVIEQIHAKLMEFEEGQLRSSSWFSVLAP
ncbi:uncharacterized protein LOC125314884 [Rhodamnia argentea]|uniref:Uncharacterized protein LOC125314884 n=1 Tax=Rhodamnia argentea TaxID=178133 RepID=A0ABM3HBW8_9MYRT|nr:uncharacterized protein LOC125314884 [Rhodamnia argentea]